MGLLKNNKAFTMIELVVGIAGYGILIASICFVFLNVNRTRKIIDNNRLFKDEGIYSINYIEKEIRSCQIIIPSTEFKLSSIRHKNNPGYVFLKLSDNNKKNQGILILYYLNSEYIKRETANIGENTDLNNIRFRNVVNIGKGIDKFSMDLGDTLEIEIAIKDSKEVFYKSISNNFILYEADKYE